MKQCLKFIRDTLKTPERCRCQTLWPILLLYIFSKVSENSINVYSMNDIMFGVTEIDSRLWKLFYNSVSGQCPCVFLLIRYYLL